MSERDGAAVAGNHIAVLDGVRGLAIVLVLCVHFIGDASPSSAAEHIAVKLANYGVWGVDLFFVLSGFLITGILLRSKAHPSYFRNFYIRRILRIFPLYYAILVVLFVLLPLLPHARQSSLAQSWAHEGWVWTYATNVYLALEKAWALPYVGHFWSLAVEEHFYLVWPLCVFFLPLDSLVRVCVLCSIAAPVTRIVLSHFGAGSVAVLVSTPCRLDALCVGALLAVFRERSGQGPIADAGRRYLAPLGVLTFALGAWNFLHGPLAGVVLQLRGTALALFFGALMMASIAAPPSSFLGGVFTTRVLQSLGKYSYGLYVIHGVVAYGMFEGHLDRKLTERLGSHALAMFAFAACGVIASLSMAVASYELFEKRFLRLKERLAPTTASTLIRTGAHSLTAAE